MVVLFFFFFFSSRRRHTRFDCDWSSDVCSSDLAGRIEQIGTPTEVYQQPRSEFVARFIGASNVIAGRHVGDARVEVHGRSEERRVGKEGRSRGWPER